MPAFGRAGIPEAGRTEGGTPALRGRPALSRAVRPRGAARGFPFPPPPDPGVRFRPGGGQLLPRDGIRGGVESRPGGGAGASTPSPDLPGRLASLGRRNRLGPRVPAREGGRPPRRVPGECPGVPQRDGENNGFRGLPRGAGRAGGLGDAGREIRVPRARADRRGRGDRLLRPVRRGSDLRGTAPRPQAVRRGRAGRDPGCDPAIRRANAPASRHFPRVGGSLAEVPRGDSRGSVSRRGGISCRPRPGRPTPGVGPGDGGFLGCTLPRPAGGGDAPGSGGGAGFPPGDGQGAGRAVRARKKGTGWRSRRVRGGHRRGRPPVEGGAATAGDRCGAGFGVPGGPRRSGRAGRVIPRLPRGFRRRENLPKPNLLPGGYLDLPIRRRLQETL